MLSHRATLDGLPNEILGIIEKNLRQKDLNSLCRASQVLYNALNPLLWKTVTIRAENEWRLEDLDLGLVLRPYLSRPSQDYIQHVKKVTVTAPIHQRISYRCLHGPDEFDRSMYGLEPDTPNLTNELAVSLAPFFQHLDDNQLREFSWNLGTCLPCEVAPLFGPCGYIILKQSSIESLSLITQDPCSWKKPQKSLLELRLLKKLKHLSWKGLRATKYLNDIQGVLECNADHLKSLELDVVDWDKANDRWDRERERTSRWVDNVVDFVTGPRIMANFMAWQVLQLQPSIHRVFFSALADLTLSNISFQGAASELACAFNGSMLGSLRLQNCRDCPSFLHALIDSPSGIRLKLFHLSIDDRDPEPGKLAVQKFLTAFEGLEELGLLIKPGTPRLYYWTLVTHHKSTLKRLIYHERMDPGRENRFLDMHPVGESPATGFGEFLAELTLECLAVCDYVGYLRTRLQRLNPQTPIKLVHVRISGADKHYKEDEEDEEDEGDEWDEEDEGDEERALSPDTTPPPESPPTPIPLLQRQQMSVDPHRAEQVRGLSDLASWAFGPDGLLNLQVLAYGDFSYQGRYIEDTFVFGRNRSGKYPRGSTQSSNNSDFGYSLLQKNERNDVMALYGDFLEACPVDALLRLDRDMEL